MAIKQMITPKNILSQKVISISDSNDVALVVNAILRKRYEEKMEEDARKEKELLEDQKRLTTFYRKCIRDDRVLQQRANFKVIKE